MTGYWAVVATDGSITSSGSSSEGEPYVPTGATVITKEQWDTIQASPGQCRLINGVLHLAALPVPAAVDLGLYKIAASAQVDAAAETARLLYLTPGSGQALEYQQTQEDAVRALAQDPNATLAASDYPWLASEQAALHQVGQDVTLRQVAQAVLEQTQAWATIGTQIKTMRRTTKLRIDAAKTFAEVQSALDAVKWPTGA